ncbi:auxin response factor 2B isoform X2 [Hevea brasiliensis]|uniref:auxin response factor 2B isoform X2 n=1 Tax=Hevea brasiliensis TaxID=3981 RepID=UPI0025F8751A|nr:auxin response factor 2B isoform X2 [Hevea brasiliensis]
MTKQAQLISLKRGCNDALYKQLWHACAGPLVSLPFVGEQVYYFPQGHIEHELGALVHQELEQQMPPSDLPSKILCKVIKVDLQADPKTDQVCAYISLLPEPDQREVPGPNPEILKPAGRCMVHSFQKTLTASDVSKHGTLFIYQKHAEQCLPPLDMSQEPPFQQLVAKDLHGKQWHFQHIYRGNPKRHLLTSGWGEFVGSKKLAKATRSVLIFLRGENGEIRIGVRKLMGQETDVVKHGESICSGILSNAYHAIVTGNHFYVIYKPRTSTLKIIFNIIFRTIGSEFIVSVNKYREAQKRSIFNGMRFMMKFEGEDGCEKSFNGRIVHFQDNISSRWPDSEWRSIKVQWDEPCPPFLPERVSPWELELSSQPKQRNKRAQVGSIGDTSQLKRSKGKGKFKEMCSTIYERECGNEIQGNFIAQSTRTHISKGDRTENERETDVSICGTNEGDGMVHGNVIPQEKSGPTEKNDHRDGIDAIDDGTNVTSNDTCGNIQCQDSILENFAPITPPLVEYPTLPEIHTPPDVLSSNHPVFPTSQGERVENSCPYSVDDFFGDFYGFQILGAHVSDLEQICSIEGKFWENARFQRANLITAVLDELGLALSLKDKTWKSMSPDELQTIIQSIEDALNAGFKLDCLKPVLQKAKAVLGSFDTCSQIEALEKEKSFLETRIQNVTCQLQTLGIELRSNTEGLDFESKCLAHIFD